MKFNHLVRSHLNLLNESCRDFHGKQSSGNSPPMLKFAMLLHSGRRGFRFRKFCQWVAAVSRQNTSGHDVAFPWLVVLCPDAADLKVSTSALCRNEKNAATCQKRISCEKQTINRQQAVMPYRNKCAGGSSFVASTRTIMSDFQHFPVFKHDILLF